MSLEETKKTLDEVVEYMSRLEEGSEVDTTMNDHLPQESKAHQELRDNVAPLLQKVHKDYNRLFCDAYEKHDLAKAQKLRKLLEQMLTSLRSSD